MASKQVVNDLRKYIESFDRYFISFHAVSNAQNAEFLVKFLLGINIKPKSIIINKETKTALDSHGLFSKLQPLIDAGLMLVSPQGYIPFSYEDIVKNLYKAGKRYKILLITLDDNEGHNFEKLDAMDNHINDIDAVSFDLTGNFYQYLFKAPKEDVLFKIKLDKPVEWVRVIFIKTEVSGFYTALYEKGNAKTLANKTGDYYSYVIDKSELFESDKIAFIAKINGKELTTGYNDFFFDKAQAWFLNVGVDRIIATINEKAFTSVTSGESTPVSQTVEVDSGDNQTVPESEKFKFYGDIKNPKKITLPKEVLIPSELKVLNKAEYAALEGRILKSDRGASVKIGKFLGDGGEGAVFLSSTPNMVIKLFKDNCRNNYRKEKIEFMTKNRITHPNIAWPQDSLYDSKGNFVGYQMMSVVGPKGKGDLSKMMNNPVYCQKARKNELVAAIVSICQTMEYLHQRNVVLGDIKLENFVIRDTDFQKGDYSKVIFVDCDSYQIDRFPCPVFSSGYIAPEANMQMCKTYYRPIEYDRFSLFSLIFKILFRSKFPYSRFRAANEKEETIDEAAKTGIFPYFMEDNGQTEKYAPKNGACANIWSHLPKYVKQALVDAGDRKRGKNYQPINRKSAAEWQKIFSCYSNDLVNNAQLKRDSEYNIGFPVTKLQYSLVDIEMIREMVERITKVALSSTVMYAFTKAQIKVDPTSLQNAVNQLNFNKTYTDQVNKFSIRLIKNLGICTEIEFKYCS